MAYSPQARLVYIPAIELEATFDDSGITRENWKRTPGAALDYAVRPEIRLVEGAKHHSALVAIDPVTQKQAWRVPLPAHFPGGIAATGGGLVFQEIGRASWRERGCQYGLILVVAVSFKKKT